MRSLLKRHVPRKRKINRPAESISFALHHKSVNSRTRNTRVAAFFFFYFDRYVYSPLLQTLLRGKNVIEKNRSKNISTKAVADKFGSACESSHDVGNRTGNNGKNKNDDEMGETNAIWPEGISYVTPLEIKKKEQLKDKKFNVIYIGHMSILIQTANFNILVDPVLSTRIGLFNLMGVKRTIKAGISFEHLPSIDFILLSNNRFDTMDKSTLKKIVLRDNSIVIGGMNIRRYLFKRNFPVVYPLNWFNKIEFENLSFYYLPTVTNSHRYVVDKNVYLPGSFLIHDNKTKATIFYSGHSAYSNHFLQIKSYVNTILRRENIDLSILPIGIYKPKELYAPFHMSPEQAIQSHLDLKSKASLGVGMDVFCLGGENYNEATTELSSRLAQYEHERKEKINFVTLQPGHSIIL